MPIHISVAVVVRDERVLLVHRHPDREHYPDRWDVPGGHVEPGESAREALRRECREELGIEVDDATPVPFTTDNADLCVTAFRVTRWRGEPTNKAPDEHDDLGWFTADDIADLDLAHPTSRAELQAALH